MADLNGATVLVIGASKGLGRGVAEAFDQAGASVVAVARGAEALAELAAASRTVRAERADAAADGTAEDFIGRYRPDVLVLVAGAVPLGKPVQEYTWDEFSLHWDADVKIAFTWLKAALTVPLAPGSRVIVVSSGAGVFGSPVSGGYAPAKAAQRFLAAYAREESARGDLGIAVTAVHPSMNPFGQVGQSGITAYAARSGKTRDEQLAGMGATLTPTIAGNALVDLAQADAATVAGAYLLGEAGLRVLEAPARP
ncbi:MAG TPA: SDR family oxidoreductase [Trebonia sp.]|jgi:NAD(P)-dependent dehydrogenase (short-subunit alcohol dehydrogenase family)